MNNSACSAVLGRHAVNNAWAARRQEIKASGAAPAPRAAEVQGGRDFFSARVMNDHLVAAGPEGGFGEPSFALPVSLRCQRAGEPAAAGSVAHSSRARWVREALPKGWSCREASCIPSIAGGGVEEPSSQRRSGSELPYLLPESGEVVPFAQLGESVSLAASRRTPGDILRRGEVLQVEAVAIDSLHSLAHPARTLLWATPSRRRADVLNTRA